VSKSFKFTGFSVFGKSDFLDFTTLSKCCTKRFFVNIEAKIATKYSCASVRLLGWSMLIISLRLRGRILNTEPTSLKVFAIQFETSFA